jgi:TRAP transporter TAXI family solute receptor
MLLTVVAIPTVGYAQDNLPHVNLCTGVKDGNYDFVGIQIAFQAKGSLHGTLINTAGSLENLAKLDAGTCDAAIVQSDAYSVYLKQNSHSNLTLERGRALYPEYVHFICNKDAGLSKITGLQKTQTVLVGPAGSGSAVTWDSFKAADPARYGSIPTQPIGGTRAAGKVQDGSDAACMFAVIGLKAPGINAINDVAKTSNDRILLINAQDSDMPGVKDPKGKTMYEKASIPGGTYPDLQHGMLSTSVPTITVMSILVANSNWVDANGPAYDALLKAVNQAMPAINQRVGG